MRYLVAIVLFSTLVSLATGTSFAYDWYIATVDYECGAYTSIAIDSQDHPNISYTGIRFAKWTGTEWDIQIVDPEGGTNTSIALDSQDYPHISYHFSYDYSYDLRYARWTGSAWEIQTLDTEGNTGQYTSIAIDNYDYPHISYWGGSNLKYAHWNGSEWDIQVVDSEGDVGRWTSIALDNHGYPNISYYNSTNEDLMYAKWTGSEWDIQIVDSEGEVGFCTSLELDSMDYPHISYCDFTGYPECYLKYAYWTGSYWQIQTVAPSGFYNFSSIAVDSQDHPHISFFLEWIGCLKYAYWNGSSWEIITVDNEYYTGEYLSIALDSQDHPFISYSGNFENDNLRCAYYGDPLDIDLLSFSAHPEDSAIALDWSVQTTEDEQILGFNLYRREINNNIAGEVSNLGCIWTKVNTGLITGQNPYTYTDSDVESGVAYEYKLEAVLADDSPETLGTTQATAGLPQFSFAILALYPNPASNYLTCLLALPSAGVVDLSLYDISGRLVLVQQLEPTEPAELEAILDISGLASGVYTLRASSGGTEASARAVVVR